MKYKKCNVTDKDGYNKALYDQLDIKVKDIEFK